MRFCLDTNVLVAAFATRGLCADVLRTVLAEHDLVIGEVILTELRRTLAAKFKLPADRVEAVAAVLLTVPVIPKPDAPSALPITNIPAGSPSRISRYGPIDGWEESVTAEASHTSPSGSPIHMTTEPAAMSSTSTSATGLHRSRCLRERPEVVTD